MTYVQFAKEHKLVTDYEVQGHVHGGLMAAHMPNSYHRRYKKKLTELQEARADGLRRYKAAIERGDILPPSKLSMREELELKAGGHPDLPSTQAAIRLLERLNAKDLQPPHLEG